MQVGFTLNNKTDAVALIKALKQSGNEQQLALARLLSTLTVKGYSQKKVMEAGDIALSRLARLLKSVLFRKVIKVFFVGGSKAMVR